MTIEKIKIEERRETHWRTIPISKFLKKYWPIFLRKRAENNFSGRGNSFHKIIEYKFFSIKEIVEVY